MDWERGTNKGPFNFLCLPSNAFSYYSWSGLSKRQAQLCHIPLTFKILKWLFIILKTKIKSLNRTCTALHDVTCGRIKMPQILPFTSRKEMEVVSHFLNSGKPCDCYDLQNKVEMMLSQCLCPGPWTWQPLPVSWITPSENPETPRYKSWDYSDGGHV